jgi:clathrin heavy chain
MVNDTSVFHWTISDQTSPPQKIFDCHATLSGAQIINYQATPDEKLLVLIGIFWPYDKSCRVQGEGGHAAV